MSEGTNSKKLTVAILLILTLIIGAITIYLGFFLRTKLGGDEPTPTPLPYTTATPTPTIEEPVITGKIGASVTLPATTSTATITTPAGTPAALIACGQPCQTGKCSDGNQCISVDGGLRCVNNACLNINFNPPILNSNCQADLCTPLFEIEIKKEAAVSCATGSNKKLLVYKIKLTNPLNNPNPRTNITVKDELDSKLVPYINKNSISNNGTITNNLITWDNLNLSAKGGIIELKFELTLPPLEYGKTFSNTAYVLENSFEKGRISTSTLIEVIPCTALISDEADRIIIGIGLIFLGVLLYRMKFHSYFGNLLYKYGGKEFMHFLEISKQKYEEKYSELRMTKKERFENKIIRKNK